LVQPRFWIGEGILRITDRTQRLVAYLDQIERCLGGELVLGNHGGDWIDHQRNGPFRGTVERNNLP
ncbi:MAG: hypothetical protein V3S16_02940, partial [Candidatus Desulfatibia sp.]|uniref:hypothetical protein n=1 Tax=Candidatus Desulfatibia sp. TaxID=3101189 RepID=UPI002F2C5C5C